MSLQFVTRVASRGADSWRAAGPVCFEKPGAALFPAFYALMERCEAKHNGYVALRLDMPHRPRSTGPRSQNHRLNGFVSQFCQASGNDFDDIKLYIKRRAMRRGLPPKKDSKGSILYSRVDGEPLPMSEKDMSVEQCGWCIAEIEQLAAENGVTLQESEE